MDFEYSCGSHALVNAEKTTYFLMPFMYLLHPRVLRAILSINEDTSDPNPRFMRSRTKKNLSLRCSIVKLIGGLLRVEINLCFLFHPLWVLQTTTKSVRMCLVFNGVVHEIGRRGRLEVINMSSYKNVHLSVNVIARNSLAVTNKKNVRAIRS